MTRQGNIVPLMQGILEALGPQVEIIVVDDDSPDGTAGLVRGFAQEHPQVRLVHRTTERGLTSAIAPGASPRAAARWWPGWTATSPCSRPTCRA